MLHLSNHVNKNRATNDELFGWDAMIRDARKKIEDLNFSIKVFEQRKAMGEPWPGTQSQGHDSGQQH